MLLILIGVNIISLMFSAGFVCCDSAKTRKLFAVALVLGAFGVGFSNLPVLAVNLVLRVYWAYEMWKLAKFAEEGSSVRE